MTRRQAIHSDEAPAAIGPYSQACRAGDLVFCSGQIPLRADGEVQDGDMTAQAEQVFGNLAALARAAGGSLTDVVRLTLYLTDLDEFAEVNAAMQRWFAPPWPARATVGVAALPRGARLEADAILYLPAA